MPTVDSTEKPLQPDVRDHLANERTFLAWMRTSLAIITFVTIVILAFSGFALFLVML